MAEYGVGISNPYDLLGEDNAALKKAPKEGEYYSHFLFVVRFPHHSHSHLFYRRRKEEGCRKRSPQEGCP